MEVKTVDKVYHIPEQDILHKVEIDGTNEFIIMDKNGKYFIDGPFGVYSSKVIDEIAKEIMNVKIS